MADADNDDGVRDTDPDEEAVELGVGKDRDTLVLARPQNCWARDSAVPRSLGHCPEIHETKDRGYVLRRIRVSIILMV